MELTLTPNIAAPDDFYAALLATHDGLSCAESEALNARLILILALFQTSLRVQLDIRRIYQRLY